MADLTPELLDKLEAIAKAATPGPWQWFGNTRMREVYLATVDRGRTLVMDFVRWGMSGAQPRFQDRQRHIMRSLGEMAKSEEANGPDFEVPYRRDFAGIGHPDAKHIAAASPDVVLALVAATRERDQLRAQLAQPPSTDLEPFCDGCGQEIDPTTCGCGSEMPCYEHGIPMGCCCLRADHGDGDIAKGLRARLREERAAAAKELDQLRAEAASLRAPVLPVSEAAETMVGGMMAEARAAMHDEIEGKP